jgi:prevent-host-death family protein
MLSEISVSELKRDLSGIINQAAYGKQRIVIGSRGKPKAAMISMEDLHLLESLSLEQSLQARRMSALEAARVVRADIAARTGGPLPDSTEHLRELREVRTDELSSLH